MDAWETIEQYRKRISRDSRVLERLRITQAMFVVVQKNRGPTLNLARNLINMPNGQVVDSGSESESSKKNIKKEKRQQMEKKKKITKDQEPDPNCEKDEDSESN